MLEPTGPLSPSVYWRRRALAGGVCVVAVVLLAWIIGGLVGSADDHPVQGTVGARNLVVAAPSAPAQSSRAASASASASASSTARTAEPTAPGSPPTEHSANQPTGRPVPTSRPAPMPTAPPKRCADKALRVVAQPGAQSYRVGERPLLRLMVVNTGDVPCTRDVSRQLRELVITTANGGKRLWSSNDCFAPAGVDKRTLRPAETLRFSLNWAGRTSAPGCPVDRTTVEAGRYRVIGKLGELTGPPATLTMTR